MAERQYFSTQEERNKALAAAGSGYTYGTTTGANFQNFFIEKKPSATGGTSAPSGTGVGSSAIPVPAPAAPTTQSDYIKEIKREPGKVTIQYGNSPILKPELRNQVVTYINAGSGKGEYKIVGDLQGKTFYDEQNNVMIKNGQLISAAAQPTGSPEQPQPTSPQQFTEAEKQAIIKADPHAAFGLGIITEQEMASIINARQKAANVAAVKEESIRTTAASPEAKVLHMATEEWMGFGTLFSLGISLASGKSYEDWLKAKQLEREDWIRNMDIAVDTGKTQEWIAGESLKAGVGLGLGMAGGGALGQGGIFAARAAGAGFTGLQFGETIKNPTTENIIASVAMGGLMIPTIKSAYSEAQQIKAARSSETRTVAGVSYTVPKDAETLSRGEFQVLEGRLKGLKGTTTMEQNVQKGRGFIATEIPEQKLGGREVLGKTFGGKKVPAQSSTSYTQELPPVQTETGTLLHRISNKFKIMAGQESDMRTVKPVGNEPAETFLKKVGEVSGRKSTITTYRGVSDAAKVSDYNLEVVKSGGKTVMIETSDVTGRIATKIAWTDVMAKATGERAGGKVTPYKVGTLDVISGKATATAKSALPLPDLSNVKVDIGARIVPNVNPVPGPVRIKQSPDLATPSQQLQVDIPKIIRKQDEGQQGRTVVPTIPAIDTSTGAKAELVTPQITKNWDTSKQKISPTQIPVTNPITGQTQSRESVSAIRQQLEPIISRIANQPVPDIPNIPPVAPGAVLPWLPPGLYGIGSSKAGRYKTSHVTNPVPEIEELIGQVQGIQAVSIKKVV